MKVCLYCRVSTDRQVDEGASLAAQESKLRAWASVYDHDVAYVAVEKGVSGSIAPSERPEFGRVLRDLDAHEIDGVAAVALDRLSRSTMDTLALAEQFRARGWKLISLAEQIDTTSAAGELVLTVLAAMSQFERKRIGERTSAALAQRKKDGRRYSGHAPWGMRYEGKRLVPCEREREIATYLGYFQKESSAYVAVLVQAAYGPHPRTGQPWKASDVQSIRRALKRAKKGEKA